VQDHGQQHDVVACGEFGVGGEVARSDLDAVAETGRLDLVRGDLADRRQVEDGRPQVGVAPTQLDVVGPGAAADVEQGGGSRQVDVVTEFPGGNGPGRPGP
jgi:hypothetical protein